MSGRSSLSSSVLLPTFVIVVMAVVSAMGFRGVFPDWTFASAAVIGAVGAALVMLIARWARLVAGEAIGLSLVAFILLGAIAAEGVPSPAAFGTFFDGLVNGWARVLSSSPPAELTPEFRVLPYSIAWAGSMLGAEMVRSTRLPGLPAIGPVLSLAVSLLVTLEDRAVAIFQGVVMVVGAVIVGWIRQRYRLRENEYVVNADSSGRSVGLTAAGLLLVAIAAVAPILGPRMPLANANERFDLRRYQTPPFDPLDQPSPLVQLKAYLQEKNAETVLFRAKADTALNRWPFAIHNTYDGVVWAVADARFDAPAEFRPIDEIFPQPETGTVQGWESVRAEIEIVDLGALNGGTLSTVWLPSPGWPLAMNSDAPVDVRFNAGTGTIALPPSGPQRGFTYQITAAVPPGISDVSLRSAGLAVDPAAVSLPAGLPPQLRNLAGDVFEGADIGWEQVAALQRRFVDRGFYDSRELSGTARPGHSVFRIGEFLDDPERIIGFEEQYAAAAAILARNADIPARVVVGFLIDADESDERWSTGVLEVVADDISAWIEVNFEGVGWVPFDVTPPRDREPEEITQGATEKEVAVPNPPPPPPPPELPPRFEEEEEFDEVDSDEDDEVDDAESAGIGVKRVAVGAAVTSPVLFMLIGSFTVITMKARRTRRRRTSGSASRRVAGAWYEVVDRVREFGVAPPATATPTEYARGLLATDVVDQNSRLAILELAGRADEAAFHPNPAPEDAVADAWDRYDVVISAIAAGQGRARRFRARLDPRPLIRRDPLARTEATQ